ncbi:histone-lysine N-methyltransferase SETMAR [Trichonephila clavipes]|nr:histone-lysine N-methyltransferase SETMAR [Trichonephila clavipes]
MGRYYLIHGPVPVNGPGVGDHCLKRSILGVKMFQMSRLCGVVGLLLAFCIQGCGVVPARISSQSSRQCWRSPLPHALALIQRDFGCVLGVQQTKQLQHVAKVDLGRRHRSCYDLDRSGLPSHVGKDCINQIIKNNSNPTTQELAETLNVPQTTVKRRLVNLGFTRKLDRWVPHKWTAKQRDDRIATCIFLQQKNDPFSTRIVTGDENQKIFDDIDAVKAVIQDLKPLECYHHGIHLVSERWHVVIDSNEDYAQSDEAHFWSNGYVNKQKCRIWSEANPQVYVETPLHPEKLTVWCALWAGGILLQKR